ncbi:XylR N-terminal domain-containing protein [candidate division TA06 bacterium]|uniref:XylR N-terminal domain-containing protein n=1 Tax=candidate division TA06 bacterium TaxID=2250710 RepID=A0A933IAU6_UNCT6|nr:XylR N-terminal domain-containing protein [candidate division TA06 bacterium]
MAQTVKVPAQFESIFAEAEKNVRSFFASMVSDPTKGVITIGGERYILMRGESIFLSLRNKMIADFGAEVAASFLYDLAKTVGRSDARHFAEKLGLKDPIQRLSAGPVHFSHTGWAFVDILPESRPTPDENYLLVYNHPNTFESAACLRQGKRSDHPVCLFSAGYSAGWCSFSFGIELDAREIMCLAAGAGDCRFVMAPPQRLQMQVDKYLTGS